MAVSRRRAIRLGIELTVVMLAVGAPSLGFGGLRLSRADSKSQKSQATDSVARHVTVFAIVATPGSKNVDSKLKSIRSQLDKLVPRHGFKLLDVQNKEIVTGESVVCELRDGYKAQVSLLGPVDENGKVQVRFELFLNDGREFSTLVKTPLNQLFFCERKLADGSQLLIGVGAR